MNKKEIHFTVTDQAIRIDQSLFKKSDVIFNFKGHEVPNNFFKRVLLGIKIIFNHVPRLYSYRIIMQENVFCDSKVRQRKRK